jgi:hypothetical protein
LRRLSSAALMVLEGGYHGPYRALRAVCSATRNWTNVRWSRIQALVKRFDRGLLSTFAKADGSEPTFSSDGDMSPIAEARQQQQQQRPLRLPGGAHTCRTCGEQFNSAQGYGSHRRWCTGVGSGTPTARCSFCNALYFKNGLSIHEKFCAERHTGQRRLSFPVAANTVDVDAEEQPMDDDDNASASETECGMHDTHTFIHFPTIPANDADSNDSVDSLLRCSPPVCTPHPGIGPSTRIPALRVCTPPRSVDAPAWKESGSEYATQQRLQSACLAAWKAADPASRKEDIPPTKRCTAKRVSCPTYGGGSPDRRTYAKGKRKTAPVLTKPLLCIWLADFFFPQ